MKISEEQRMQDEADYAAAFGDDMAPAPDAEDVSDDAAPVDAELPAEEVAADAPMEPAAEVTAEAPAEEAPAEAPAETPAEPEAAEVPAEAATEDDEPTDPAERQQYKSWMGRLKAMEAKLKAREAELEARAQQPAGDKAEQTAEVLESVAEGTDNPELAAAADDAAEQVEQGSMTPQQAMASLAEDFGPDFVKLIEIIAEGKARDIAAQAADEKVGQVGGTVQQLIDALNDERLEAHYNAIAETHPDFDDIGKSEGFKAYLLAMPDTERAEAERIVGGGTAKEIIGLLSAFKESQQQTDNTENQAAETQPDDDALAAAEGVRSMGGGLKLPEKPSKGGSYEEAWLDY